MPTICPVCQKTLQMDTSQYPTGRNFAISLIQKSLSFDPTDYLNYVDFPMIAYTREFIKPKFVINQTVNWSVLDKVAKLNTTNIFIL
mgnify:FL=1